MLLLSISGAGGTAKSPAVPAVVREVASEVCLLEHRGSFLKISHPLSLRADIAALLY